MDYIETTTPVATIRTILHDYPCSESILRELLQNSDDAKAEKQLFILDKRESPALVAYNDAQFYEDDWNGIRNIHQSSKKADTSKIGKYGIGFRACYHFTDGPQILSGGSFAILDPLHSGGMKIDHDNFKKSDYRKHFDFLYDISNSSFFPGTAIRLPLRSSPSELSQKTVHVDELHQMIKKYIAKELNISLLFLDNLRTIEILELDGAKTTSLATCTKSGKKPTQQCEELKFDTYDSVLSNGIEQFAWRIVQTRYPEDEAKSCLGGESANLIFQQHKLRLDVRLAYPLSINGYTAGRLFTFLPLPSPTNFPAHIHALFALTSSRQALRNSSEEGTPGSDHEILTKWNKLLFDKYIPQAWCCLLKSLAKDDGSCEDIYTAWPPHLSSITSGDGLYWKNILIETFTIAVQSRLSIWPKVSAQNMTTFVDLRSSLVVTKGEVDLEVLISLDKLGLTIVELPKDHMQLVGSSITKLTPGSARASLLPPGTEISQGFESLSTCQRDILCKYFLSDKDLSHIYGLPLLPTVNGSYISLSNRKTCAFRYIALTGDEAEVFQLSASDAISLSRLDLEIATLMQNQGTTQANVDLLTPKVAVTYMANEPRSDESLTRFWLWLVEWHRKDDMMNLLKDNSILGLIPTSKGFQPVPSPVFRRPQDMYLGRLFEKFGLAFISSVLPPLVVHFLENHGVVKDTNNLSDFLAAINLEALPSLSFSDGEAKLVFHFFSVYYRPLSAGNLRKLKMLPVFPVLVPSTNASEEGSSNTSVAWRNIDDLTIRGVSPMRLVPVLESVYFLDKASIVDPSCSLLKSLKIRALKDKDVLVLTLDHFCSLSKSLQAAFISYIKKRNDHNRGLPEVKLMLGETKFILTSDGTFQSPQDVIDPKSCLSSLFPSVYGDRRVPKYEDDYDRKIFDDLRALKLTRASLSLDIVKERISYISSNSTSALAISISHSLVSLMNDPHFPSQDLSIDPNMRWLPTQVGLVSSDECIDGGRRDTALFDEVLATLDKPKVLSPNFKTLMGWDKSLPLWVLMKQLRCVLDKPGSYFKVREIVRELATRRRLSDADFTSLSEVVADHPWVPTESGGLAPHSRAVFTSVPDSSCFYKIGFSKSDELVYRFLLKMGCHECPTAAAIITELQKLRDQDVNLIVVQQAVKLLEMLPNSITDPERASLLIPTNTGELVSLGAGICYYKGIIDETDQGMPIAHRLISEELAGKIRIRPLGSNETDGDIDLGEKPITTIRNTLRQYNPEQFFTEFIANASDAKAKYFSILLDHDEGPTNNLISEGLATFQGASLVVYNNGIFSQDDFRGILQTGIGGKRGKSGMIGRFGLGALSMFHFTELPMIVSGKYVLFMSPSKRHLSFCGKHSIRFALQEIKRLYADHLKPLSGLFGFDINSDEPYNGTLFRLPLRKQSQLSDDSVSTPCGIHKIQAMLLSQFNNVAYKCLLFTGLNRISVFKRQDSCVEMLGLIDCNRTSVVHADDSFVSEKVSFKTTGHELPRWIIVSTAQMNIPEEYKEELAKKYDIRDLLPVRIAAALDSDHISDMKYNLFCSLPLPVTTALPVHVSAPLILEQERRNIRLDSDRIGTESKYNEWILSSEVPRLYVYLLERLLHIEGIRTNMPWWPAMRRYDADDPSRIFMDAFWKPKIVGESARLIFASKYHKPLSPKEAVLYPDEAYIRYRRTLSKIFSITQPPSIVTISHELLEHTAKINLRLVDAEFIKSLLKNCNWINKLGMDEIGNLMTYLCHEKASLDGLPLLPLADGSFVTIRLQSKSTKTYYKFEQALGATTIPFKRDRFVHEHFDAYDCILNKGYNVSYLSEEGIVELVEEYIKPACEFWGDDRYHALVQAFWNAPLNIAPEKFSHLPLIPTLRQSHFISLNKVNDSSVIVVDSVVLPQFDYGILQSLGMTIVIRHRLPKELFSTGNSKGGVYNCFLNYMQNNLAQGLSAVRGLIPSDHKKLAEWIRSEFNHTPANKIDIACMLPVWHVQQQYFALHEVTVLPSIMRANVLQPFTNQPVIDYQSCMSRVKKKGCSAKDIIHLLRVYPGSTLQAEEQVTYKQFLECFLRLGKVKGYTLLVPNKGGVLVPVDKLFEQCELFTMAFEAQSQHLLPDHLRDLVNSLEIYGLKREHRLDLQTFIECAEAFNGDRGPNMHAKSKILYRYFNNLALHRRDAYLCSALDNLRFIPRTNSQRAGYDVDDIDTSKYPANFPNVLSPHEIVIPEYEPVCWTQRCQVLPPPNSTLCGTYQSLGKPTGKEVVKHLEVLAKIGQTKGHHSALLSDLKATYRWLNDNASEIGDEILNSKPLFLNVDDPDSDDWVWHSNSSLIMDLHGVGKLHDVKDFLRNYNNLLKKAGIRRVRNVVAQSISIPDKTSHFQKQFNEMRERLDANVVFYAKDKLYKILPAHRTWLSVNSEHFRTAFLVAAEFQEARELCLREPVVVNVKDYSSHCVKEVIDWMYTNQLPDSIAINGKECADELAMAFDLALEMLSLAHFWDMTELHKHMQVVITNDFINPHTVKTIKKCAEERKAEELWRACRKFEEDNKDIIANIPEE